MKKEQIYAVQAALSAAGAWLSARLGILFPLLTVFHGHDGHDQVSGMLESKRGPWTIWETQAMAGAL